jgi:prophage regulatory protein
VSLIDINGIAEIVGLNAAHVRDRLTKRKDFPAAYRIGGALRWKRDEVDDWIESRRLSPAARRSKSRKEKASVAETVR